jgi:hypothetical protein
MSPKLLDLVFFHYDGFQNQFLITLNSIWSDTGCSIDLSSVLISISDFSDCPIKKDYQYNKNPIGLT